MRVIIGGSTLVVMLTLIILIHTSVINKSVREDEINRGLENAVDYAIDVTSSYYRLMSYDDSDEYMSQLLEFFCKAVNNAVKTEGTVVVSVMEADFANGIFDFVVEQDYTYLFGKKRATCICQRAVLLKK